MLVYEEMPTQKFIIEQTKCQRQLKAFRIGVSSLGLSTGLTAGSATRATSLSVAIE